MPKRFVRIEIPEEYQESLEEARLSRIRMEPHSITGAPRAVFEFATSEEMLAARMAQILLEYAQHYPTAELATLRQEEVALRERIQQASKPKRLKATAITGAEEVVP